MTSFWFKKKKIDPDNPVTRSKFEIQTLDRAGFKNYDFYGKLCTLSCVFIIW
jgi:hypothetical protein